MVIALCVIVPIVELVVFVKVAGWIGGWPALGLLLVISLVGVGLMRAQGVAVYRRGRAELRARRVPGRTLVDGLLVFAAGGLLVVPGFLTAIVGLLLLVPPTRAVVREWLIRRWTRNARRLMGAVAPSGPTVISARSEVVAERSDPEQLGRHGAVEPGREPLD